MGDPRPLPVRKAVVAMTVVVAALAGCTSESTQPVNDTPTTTPDVPEPRDRSMPPALGTTRLQLLDSSRPPAPVQWDGGSGSVPVGQWWSGLATGPGIPALWAEPLLLRMGADGRIDVSAPTHMLRADGFRGAAITPAAFFDVEPQATVKVLDNGPLHVRFSVESPDGTVVITLVQGSPFVEFEGSGHVTLTIPALTGLAAGSGPGVQRFSTAAGPWLLASSQDPGITIDGDTVVFDLTSGVRHALGPVPADAGDAYDAAAATVANNSLVDTSETLSVADDGTVTQVLSQQRATSSDATFAWSLLPHHVDALRGDATPIGGLASIQGTSPIVAASDVTLVYPAVPILWNPVIPTGFDVGGIALDDVPEIGTGSYFGAKHTATQALVHDVLAAGADDAAGGYLASVEQVLGQLLLPGSDPQLTWEPGWGSVVVTPTEFGSGEQLNDHQLQNGYWVGAAASVVTADPSKVPTLEDGVDLLIADYSGARAVPHLADTVPDEGTWSPYAGHSWASGLGGFADGNNLESISESSYAHWAAAKWFIASGRPALAEPFIARLTIESWLSGYQWLPTEANRPAQTTARPWTGVVWAGKADPGTWFDASDEAALGIRLLPVGPQSFSRYPNADAVQAAGDRWDWCDGTGLGCTERWWNLLDTDAVVAGRPALVTGDLPEESTTELVRRWWRAHWEATAVADGWSCTPGTTIRRTADGELIALVTNPSASASAVTCRSEDGASFETVAEPHQSSAVPVSNDR